MIQRRVARFICNETMKIRETILNDRELWWASLAERGTKVKLTIMLKFKTIFLTFRKISLLQQDHITEEGSVAACNTGAREIRD